MEFKKIVHLNKCYVTDFINEDYNFPDPCKNIWMAQTELRMALEQMEKVPV